MRIDVGLPSRSVRLAVGLPSSMIARVKQKHKRAFGHLLSLSSAGRGSGLSAGQRRGYDHSAHYWATAVGSQGAISRRVLGARRGLVQDAPRPQVKHAVQHDVRVLSHDRLSRR